MANLINENSPTDSDAAIVDNDIRSFKNAVNGIFGISNNTTIASAVASIDAVGLKKVILVDNTTSPTNIGEISRNSGVLEFYNTAARVVYIQSGSDVDVQDGGTGVSSVTDGGLLIGKGIAPFENTGALADGEFVVGDGTTNPVLESGSTVRTSLGLGTGDSPTFLNLTTTASANIEVLTVAEAADVGSLGVTGIASANSLVVTSTARTNTLTVVEDATIGSLGVTGAASANSLVVTTAASANSLTVVTTAEVNSLVVTSTASANTLTIVEDATIGSLTVEGIASANSLVATGVASSNSLTVVTTAAINSLTVASSTTLNSESTNADTIIKGKNNSALLVADSSTDSISIASAVTGSILSITPGVQARDMASSVGMAIHVTPDSWDIKASGNGHTINEGSLVRVGAPTWSSTGTSFTIASASTVVIEGPPVADNNVTITNAWSLSVASGNVQIPNSLYIREQADADGDIAGLGQVWVNTATPNELYFTDDAGTDIQLGGGVSQADQASVEAEDNEDTYVPPDLVRHSPGVAKAWIAVDLSGTMEIYASGNAKYNIASIADDGVGKPAVTVTTAFSTTNERTASGIAWGDGAVHVVMVIRAPPGNTTLQYFHVCDDTDTLVDVGWCSAGMWGDQ